MNLPNYARRRGLAIGLAASVSTLLPLKAAWGQTTGFAPRDWLAQIRQHHDLIDRSFEELLSPNERSFEQVALHVRTLDQLQTAHSMAEENLIYPALARIGMMQEAEKLYMDEAHMKMQKAQVELAVGLNQQNANWREPATRLRGMMQRHTRQDEEQRLFPELQRRLGPEENARLAQRYVAEFSRVLPVRP
ncbi:hemerythrin domain-containing protein [Ramlibacter sp. AN1015]|uniref:hemerythrin domain-containing protein n=1 Tax=Ramlibacter sp. AN1015 TaxID=3133428 RepID=UPI0030C4FEBD